MVKFRLNEGWHAGPLPPKTYNWGGVVLHKDLKTTASKPQAFHFADFGGDRVKIQGKEYLAHEVAYYNNCLCLPTGPK